MSFEVYDIRAKHHVEPDGAGIYVVRDQREYLVKSDEPIAEWGQVVRNQPLSDHRIASLYFENYVGLAEIAGRRFDVRHSKLTPAVFNAMLDEVVEQVADLSFDFASPTALPFERDGLGGSEEVRYHALAYLRHVMRRASGGEQLLGQFLQIARNPHRRMEDEARWVETHRVASPSPAGLLAVSSHPERLVAIDPTSRLANTRLAQALRVERGRVREPGRMLFPGAVLASLREESFDTHENRLVLHVIWLADDLVRMFEGRPKLNPDLQADLRVMREELDWMLTFDFLGEVGPMKLVPLQSTVLQRREGYREFLAYYLRLSLSSVLADANDRGRWHALLDLKDSALLYEMWTFFAVRGVLDNLLGAPTSVDFAQTTAERRSVPWAAKVDYQAHGVELVYNRTYRAKGGSYSVTLRPDLVLRVRQEGRWVALVLDAKLKFDGQRLSEVTDTDQVEWDRSVTREDLYKMHTYRDAITEAVGAYVLYPGDKTVMFREEAGAPEWKGVGAVPLIPGEPGVELTRLLREFLAGVAVALRKL